MQRYLAITPEPIEEALLIASRPQSTSAGAIVTFLGVVRDSEKEASITALEYEAFDAMARHQFNKLLDQLEQRWPVIQSIRVIHRTGVIPAGIPSLWIELTAPHRAEAFAALQWFIDEMKRVVPIWKRPVPLS